MKNILLTLSFLSALAASANEPVKKPVEQVRFYGPVQLHAPLLVDSTNASGKKFEADKQVDFHLALSNADKAELINITDVTERMHNSSYALALMQFEVSTQDFVKAKINVDSVKTYRLFLDGQSISGGSEQQLLPGTHKVTVKLLAAATDTIKPSINVEGANAGLLTIGDGTSRFLSQEATMAIESSRGASFSPNGKWMIVCSYKRNLQGKGTWKWRLEETDTGRLLLETTKNIKWMPKSNLYYYQETEQDGPRLVCIDPATNQQTIFAKSLPSGMSYTIAPTEDWLLCSKTEEGPKEDKDMNRLLEPDDRQPGWRNRTSYWQYDIASGTLQALTFAHRSLSVWDIAPDGNQLLLAIYDRRLTARPTSITTLLLLDRTTMHTDTLALNEGFIGGGKFSPDGTRLLITGSPESFNSIGKNVPEGRIPNGYDIQMYVMELSTKKVIPVTKNFNPSINSTVWHRQSGDVFFTADDGNYVSLFRMNGRNYKITKIASPEDYNCDIQAAADAPIISWSGEGISHSYRLYTLSLDKKATPRLMHEYNTEYAEGLTLGKAEDWSFRSSRGDEISGFYYLPPNFDPTKKYPLIVYYYGGCSPSSRYFEGRYPNHLYAAQGYVVYVINPSGAAGFGQEYASRHVNTAGEGVADDIIEGTKAFCKEHPFVNDKKIGCIGASYGGFMTQYLQTKTDLFAAAISHAGISDHTQYWGEGYWGYSYSEVSMANSYPWTDKDLYVDHSPIYNVDKITTPLLFLHGSVDHNVPIANSIQMYTALKLLGRQTDFVIVDGEDHVLSDYNKTKKWQNTIFAWFARYLKDDPTWWDTLYPDHKL